MKSLVFDRVPAPADPWGSKSIEWQLPSPVPVHNFDRIPVFSSDPYGYGEARRPDARSGRRSGGDELMAELAQDEHGYEVVEGEPPEVLARNLDRRRASCSRARRRSSSSRSSSRTSISGR